MSYILFIVLLLKLIVLDKKSNNISKIEKSEKMKVKIIIYQMTN